MSLTTGRGPLGNDPAGRFNAPVAPGLVYVEPFLRRVRGLVGGRTVVDSEAVLLVHRAGSPPTYAFPEADVSVPSEPEPEAPGHVRVDWASIEVWYEEAEQVHGHPRNPYHRIDCVATSRRLTVRVGDDTLVDCDRPLGLYETALAPRLYVAPSEVRMELLVPSTTTSYCPYKGTATYWSAVVGDRRVDDVAWTYEDPLPESLPIRGMLCFDETRVDVEHDLPI